MKTPRNFFIALILILVYQASSAQNQGTQKIDPDFDKIVDQPSPGLVISEIMFNPASDEDDWEWIEVYNPGNTGINLEGYVIDDNNSSSHASANISGGLLKAGETAVLFNSDDISESDFKSAWGADINLMAVSGWSAMSLNNSTDTIGIWQSFEEYSGDHKDHLNTIVTVSYPDIDNDAGSVFLTDLTDQNSFVLSEEGSPNPFGNLAYTSSALGGNSGEDVGSPGDKQEVEESQLPKIMGFVLVDATANSEIMSLSSEMTLDLSNLPSKGLNIRAFASETTNSVYLELKGERDFSRTENVVPYALFGDKSGNYFGRKLPPGDYELTATPYSEDRLGGERGNSVTIDFKIGVNLEILEFKLVDAESDQEVAIIAEGSQIDLPALAVNKINIRAIAKGAVESVQFLLTGDQNSSRIENIEPYALFGDISGNYKGVTLKPGDYHLEAIPYTKNRGQGIKGSSLKVNFSVASDKISPLTKENQILSIYPNPADEKTYLVFESARKIKEIKVFSLFGGPVKRFNSLPSNLDKEFRLDVSDLARGTYFLKILDSEGRSYQKKLLVK